MKIAFYAPMKAPDHPTPSGDRRMARLLIAALGASGYDIEVVSRLRSYLPAPAPDAQRRIREDAANEAARIAARWEEPDSRPDLWFTYHNYHKAPDLLGPGLARQLGIPYVVAEASRAPRRAGPWTDWYAAAEAAIGAADLHICFTARDRTGIEPAMRAEARAIDLPPFIDSGNWPQADRRPHGTVPRLITVAMMRAGDKLDSYRLLAAALERLQDLAWELTIVGDGAARRQVEIFFADVAGSRLRWTGLLPADAVRDELARSDLYVWPGFGEAFGLSYLEAQAMGLPVVALDVAGVSSVVQSGTTGVLVPDPSPGAYATAIRQPIEDPKERGRMGRAAADWVRRERTLEGASRILDDALQSVIAPRRARVLA